MLNPDPSQPLENLSIWRTGVAGAMTGCIISCFYCPMEFLKIRMQTQTMFNAKYSSMGDCAKQIISKHGPMTLYRGFLPTLLRDSACFAGYFMCYNTMKSYYLKNYSKDGEIPLWYLLFSGGMSGISCWLTSYPQDIIKSNMQTSNERVTVRQVIRRIYGDMGVRGFFKGFAPTLLRSFPANGATFFGYELALSFINKSS
jgi:solute carrier family 25 carnitine/acylcarnitine transporter 20/29